ncbi:MAG: Inositol 2-dehydrogenase/D-chiro-inositol 3-dehydrogenase [Planctomycetota bacterium]|jgi:predicted dehydrogenase
MRLRVGIVGLGSQWESRHLPALRSLADRFEVRGICEQVAHLAKRAAAELGAVSVDGFRALAARDDIDAILYFADQWYGATPILAACDHGKAVYSAISLPLAPDEAAALRRRVDASGIAFMAELPRRHAPATVRLKELIATRLGRPRLLFCHRRVPQSAPPAAAARDRATEARDLMELVDWCRYVVGEDPTSVVSVRHAEQPDGDLDDYQMMSLDFSPAPTSAPGRPAVPGNGALAQISCGYYMQRQWEEAVGFRPPAALQVACDRGIAFIDLPATLVWFDEAGRHQESLESDRPVGEQMLLQFHRKVTSLVRAVSGLDDTLKAMRIVQAAATSQAEGRRVPVDGEPTSGG